MMERIKSLFAMLFGGVLYVEGRGRTFAKVPLWLVVLATLASPHLAVITVLLAVAFGMRASVARA